MNSKLAFHLGKHDNRWWLDILIWQTDGSIVQYNSWSGMQFIPGHATESMSLDGYAVPAQGSDQMRRALDLVTSTPDWRHVVEGCKVQSQLTLSWLESFLGITAQEIGQTPYVVSGKFDIPV
jgi:hypothetical protein